MILPTALISLVLLSASNLVQAAPQNHEKREPEPLTIPLTVRASMERRDHSASEWAQLANRIKGKYGISPAASNKRALITASSELWPLLTSNHFADGNSKLLIKPPIPVITLPSP